MVANSSRRMMASSSRRAGWRLAPPVTPHALSFYAAKPRFRSAVVFGAPKLWLGGDLPVLRDTEPDATSPRPRVGPYSVHTGFMHRIRHPAQSSTRPSQRASPRGIPRYRHLRRPSTFSVQPKTTAAPKTRSVGVSTLGGRLAFGGNTPARRMAAGHHHQDQITSLRAGWRVGLPFAPDGGWS